MTFDLHHHRERVYWICQLLGWLVFMLTNLFLLFVSDKFSVQQTIVIIYMGILGIAFTHIYRRFIKKKKWLNLSIRTLLFRIVLYSFLISITIIAILITVVIIGRIYPVADITVSYIIYNLININTGLIVWSVLYFAGHSLENYKTVEIEKLIWEAAVKDFELKTLKSQLNPHFMFNALNSIRALVEENPERAKKAITQLSNILRYSLKIERAETVTLEEEIKTIEDYLALEQVRFEERLRYTITVDPNARGVEIPPMMIQTLIENGIKHGVSKLPQGGEIQLTAGLNDSNLEIQISNSGTLNLPDNAQPGGFGLSNTKQRLHLLFGAKASFSLVQKGQSVLAIVKIPVSGKN